MAFSGPWLSLLFALHIHLCSSKWSTPFVENSFLISLQDICPVSWSWYHGVTIFMEKYVTAPDTSSHIICPCWTGISDGQGKAAWVWSWDGTSACHHQSPLRWIFFLNINQYMFFPERIVSFRYNQVVRRGAPMTTCIQFDCQIIKQIASSFNYDECHIVPHSCENNWIYHPTRSKMFLRRTHPCHFLPWYSPLPA
jgi:hypothetical protein